MSSRFFRLAAGMMLVFCLAGTLAACGKKGAPAAPKDAPNVYPRAYPSDSTQPAEAPDRSAFPSLDPPNTNLDPTQPRTTE